MIIVILNLTSRFQFCMLSSTLFHTFSCHSEEAHDSWQETDHLGILSALFGTYISLLSIVFTCFPVSKKMTKYEYGILKCSTVLEKMTRSQSYQTLISSFFRFFVKLECLYAYGYIVCTLKWPSLMSKNRKNLRFMKKKVW